MRLCTTPVVQTGPAGRGFRSRECFVGRSFADSISLLLRLWALTPEGLRRSFSDTCLFVVVVFAIFAAAPLSVRAQNTRSRLAQIFPTQGNPVQITPLYDASMLIEVGNKSIYVDPARPANFADLSSADLILITDTHRDHFDPISVAAVGTPYTQILAPPDVVKTLSAARSISIGEITQWNVWIIEAVPIYDKRRAPRPTRSTAKTVAPTVISSIIAARLSTSREIPKSLPKYAP